MFISGPLQSLFFSFMLNLVICFYLIISLISGSSTACVVFLNRENSTLYTANIGDSGFMVVRRGRVVRRSEEQQHYFNTPFQVK